MCRAALCVVLVLQLVYGGAEGCCKRRFTNTTEHPDDCALLIPVPCYVDGTGGPEDLEFPNENTRTCYRTCHDDSNMYSPSFCTASLTGVHNKNISKDSDPVLNATTSRTIASPNFNDNENYRKSTICRYDVTCPAGQVLAYMFLEHILENQTDSCTGSDTCVDYVEITYPCGETEKTCGHGGNIGVLEADGYNSAVVEFYANREEEDTGFQLNLLCFVPGTVPSRKRSVRVRETTGEDRSCVEVGSDVKRLEVNSSQELQDELQLEGVREDLGSEGRRNCSQFIIRELESLYYKAGQLAISKSSWGEGEGEGSGRMVEIVAAGVSVLGVSSRLERSRVIRQSAPQPIPGYADLWVCGERAYLLRMGIDPQTRPTQKETDIIFRLRKAVGRARECDYFFDVYDEEDVIEAQEDGATERVVAHTCKNTFRRDQRLDDLARRYGNACNIFLRAAACTYQAAIFKDDCSAECCVN